MRDSKITILGLISGFINHSDDPNLVLVEEGDLKYVRTTRDVKVGEELTLKYTLYKVCGDKTLRPKGLCRYDIMERKLYPCKECGESTCQK